MYAFVLKEKTKLFSYNFVLQGMKQDEICLCSHENENLFVCMKRKIFIFVAFVVVVYFVIKRDKRYDFYLE